MMDDDDNEMKVMLARAEAAVAALARDYIAWARADIDLCRRHLTAAQQEPEQRRQHVAALYGVAHNIKGQGTSFGFPLMTRLGQSLCQLTRQPHASGDTELALADRHLQVMSDVLQQDARGDGPPALQAAVQKIEHEVETLGITG
jgi:hypothetical protein